MVEKSVSTIKNISAFLEDLTAVSLSHYQLWDYKGNMVFSTDKIEADFLTTTARLEMAKNVILSNAFSYTPVEKNQYLCGLPIDIAPATQGAILAMGPRPNNNDGKGHSDQLESFLGRIARLAHNGSSDKNESPHQAQEPMEQDFEDLYLFANISKQFRSLRFKQPVLGKLLQRMATNLRADAAFLRIYGMPQFDILEICSDIETGNGNPDELGVQLKNLVTAGIHRCSGNYCMVNDSSKDKSFETLSERPYRFISAAVRHMRKMYGWVGLVSYQIDKPFKERDLDIVQTLANQLASMFANMEQHDDLEKFTVNIVCSLVNAIEAKDAFVRGHSKRVHQYAMQMARLLKLSIAETEALKWATVLHDIGKIGIPERILSKPGKLTDREFHLIRQHPIKGKTILEPIRQLRPSMEAIAYHHERYDGKGYPEGLKGEEIPLPARIIAVADTFDALTSARSYHESKSQDEALLVLDQVAGTQLDPYLVRVFKKAHQTIVHRENKKIKNFR